MNKIFNLPPEFPANTYVAIDTEIFQMDGNQLHRPNSGYFACMTVCANPDTVYIIEDSTMIPTVLDRIKDCIWVLHNAKFDLVQLRRWANVPSRTKLIDTMLMEKILWGGYYDLFSLDDLARRYLNIYVDKTLQKSFIDANVMSLEMYEYAATDASITLQIWNEQRKYVTKTAMDIWREIDLPCLWAILDFQGFRLNVTKWEELATRNRNRQEEIDGLLPFNPRSNPQAVKFYKANGFDGISNNQKETVEDFIERYPNSVAADYARLAMESKNCGTLASRYGMSFIENYLERESDDVSFIKCDYSVIGAETGRMSASSPAMHQIPSRNTKEYRECFIARPGNKIIVADYSQQEVFIMAYCAKDKTMMEICNSGQDIYIQNAKIMYGKDIEKSDPLRKLMKDVVLGTDYGMSEYGLAKRAGITKEEAIEVLNTFYSKFPGVYKYIETMKQSKNYVTTLKGRKVWLNPYSSQSERNALNAPIQGTASDMLKLAIGRLHREWNFPCPFGVVEVTHDEIGLDVPEELAKDVAKFTETIMVEVANKMCPGMKFKADAFIGDSWADKE